MAGSGAGQYALDATTGIVTWVPDVSRAIAGITRANPAVITASRTASPTARLVSGSRACRHDRDQRPRAGLTAAGATTTTFQCAGLDASAFHGHGGT